MKAKRANYTVTKEAMEAQSVYGIYEHEKALLEELHGAGNVVEFTAYKTRLAGKNEQSMYHEQTDEAVVFPVVEIDEAAEYGRLEAKYGMHPDIPNTTISEVYGRYNMHGLANFGEKEYKGIDAIPEHEWIQVNKQTSSDEGGYEEKYKLSLKNVNQLRQLARGAGLDMAPSDTKADIIQKLVNAGVAA